MEESVYARCSGCGLPTKVLRPVEVPVYHYQCAQEIGLDHGPQEKWSKFEAARSSKRVK